MRAWQAAGRAAAGGARIARGRSEHAEPGLRPGPSRSVAGGAATGRSTWLNAVRRQLAGTPSSGAITPAEVWRRCTRWWHLAGEATTSSCQRRRWSGRAGRYVTGREDVGALRDHTRATGARRSARASAATRGLQHDAAPPRAASATPAVRARSGDRALLTVMRRSAHYLYALRRRDAGRGSWSRAIGPATASGTRVGISTVLAGRQPAAGSSSGPARRLRAPADPRRSGVASASTPGRCCTRTTTPRPARSAASIWSSAATRRDVGRVTTGNPDPDRERRSTAPARSCRLSAATLAEQDWWTVPRGPERRSRLRQLAGALPGDGRAVPRTLLVGRLRQATASSTRGGAPTSPPGPVAGSRTVAAGVFLAVPVLRRRRRDVGLYVAAGADEPVSGDERAGQRRPGANPADAEATAAGSSAALRRRRHRRRSTRCRTSAGRAAAPVREHRRRRGRALHAARTWTPLRSACRARRPIVAQPVDRGLDRLFVRLAAAAA